MIKTMKNEPTLLLRVIASIVVDSHRKQLSAGMGDDQQESGQGSIEVCRRQQNES